MPRRHVATGVVWDNRSLEPKNAIVLGCDIKVPLKGFEADIARNVPHRQSLEILVEADPDGVPQTNTLDKENGKKRTKTADLHDYTLSLDRDTARGQSEVVASGVRHGDARSRRAFANGLLRRSIRRKSIVLAATQSRDQLRKIGWNGRLELEHSSVRRVAEGQTIRVKRLSREGDRA
jgi:hypothetical protein